MEPWPGGLRTGLWPRRKAFQDPWAQRRRGQSRKLMLLLPLFCPQPEKKQKIGVALPFAGLVAGRSHINSPNVSLFMSRGGTVCPPRGLALGFQCTVCPPYCVCHCCFLASSLPIPLLGPSGDTVLYLGGCLRQGSLMSKGLDMECWPAFYSGPSTGHGSLCKSQSSGLWVLFCKTGPCFLPARTVE